MYIINHFGEILPNLRNDPAPPGGSFLIPTQHSVTTRHQSHSLSESAVDNQRSLSWNWASASASKRISSAIMASNGKIGQRMY